MVNIQNLPGQRHATRPVMRHEQTSLSVRLFACFSYRQLHASISSLLADGCSSICGTCWNGLQHTRNRGWPNCCRIADRRPAPRPGPSRRRRPRRIELPIHHENSITPAWDAPTPEWLVLAEGAWGCPDGYRVSILPHVEMTDRNVCPTGEISSQKPVSCRRKTDRPSRPGRR
jgi:hypothetical protein